jgi:hypothetical protein
MYVIVFVAAAGRPAAILNGLIVVESKFLWRRNRRRVDDGRGHAVEGVNVI